MSKFNSTLTVDRIMALAPCDHYPREQIEALLDRPLDTQEQVVDMFLSIPADDARWLLARLLSAQNRVVWARACAQRAAGAAGAARASRTARTPGWADYEAAGAAQAAYWAAGAAHEAARAAQAAQRASGASGAHEHRTAVEHAVQLLSADGNTICIGKSNKGARA